LLRRSSLGTALREAVGVQALAGVRGEFVAVREYVLGEVKAAGGEDAEDLPGCGGDEVLGVGDTGRVIGAHGDDAAAVLVGLPMTE
jgi:hypothetical protein